MLRLANIHIGILVHLCVCRLQVHSRALGSNSAQSNFEGKSYAAVPLLLEESPLRYLLFERMPVL